MWSCSKDNPSLSQLDPQKRQLIKEGKLAYLKYCSSCHNTDPNKEGLLGPPVWGASKELLRHRIQDGSYPPGYTPKRNTGVMVKTPPKNAIKDLDSIFEYLNYEN